MEDSLKSIIDKAVEFETDECTPNKTKINSSSSSTSLLLPEICIFCSLNINKQRTREYLRKCQVKQVRETLEKYEKEKNGFNMISLLSTNDIIAAEAQYHPSCCQDYTRPKNSGKKNNDRQYLQYKNAKLEAFHLVITNHFEVSGLNSNHGRTFTKK